MNAEFNIAEQSKVASDFLYTYGYTGADSRIIEKRIFATAWEAKSYIRSVLRNHPKWDEEQQAVIFDATIETGINSEAIASFSRWLRPLLVDAFYQKYGVKEIDGVNLKELQAKVKKFGDIREALRYASCSLENDGTDPSGVRYQNWTYNDARRLFDQFDDQLDALVSGYHFSTDRGIAITMEDLNKINRIKSFVNGLYEVESSLATEQFANKVNELFPDIRCTVGQKVSRIISRIGREFGLDKITDVRQIMRNGEMVDKDYGWNYQFALFGDAINPVTVHQFTVISINPFDYWTMSFGKDWASCHTIDKNNLRHIRENHYHGCYSAGTESYMLDESSIVMYTVDPDYVGKMWEAPKSRRCMFHVAQTGECFIQGRLYPDGRDGGEKGMAAQFRNIFQRVWSEAQEEPNYWTVQKGTNICEEYSCSRGHHYRDYCSYDDCCFSVRKGSEAVVINIGHNAICPCCGEEHGGEESICCDRCNDDTIGVCEHCGCAISTDDDYVEVSDGTIFCCAECAESAGYVWCENSETYTYEDYAYFDPYTERWYDDEPEVRTEDGNCFYEEENAISYGYRQCEDECWYLEDECMYDDYEEGWYIDTDDGVSIADKWYHNEETARLAGYTLSDNGEWIKEVA